MTAHHRFTGKKWVYDFGPAQWVIDDLFTDLAAFMDEPLESTMRKCRMGADRVSRLWECEMPQTEEERQQWYRQTDAHIYEGANWHSEHPAPLQRWNIAQKCRGDVLIYGCGIGTEGLFALYNPNVKKVTFFDLPYSQILDFVWHRILSLATVEGLDFYAKARIHLPNPLDAMYDTIVCMDVLEHLEDPQAVLNQFGQNLNSNGLLLVDAPFEDVAPVGHLEQHRELDLDEMIARAGIANYEKNLLR